MIDQPLFELGRAHRVRGQGIHIRLHWTERVYAARGYRQAIVKVTSYATGRRNVAHHLTYISRDGKLELETDRGEILTTREDQKELLDRWAVDFDDRPKSRDAVNIVFSMPPGSSKEALKAAIRTTLGKQFPEHESVFAIHEDRQHPHAHTVIKMRGQEAAKKLRLNKPELYKLRQAFAQAAREQGVKLSATPRFARGIGKKAARQELYFMRKRGIKPKVDREAGQEARLDFERGGREVKLWERALSARNELEREQYRLEARKLRERAAKEGDAKARERFLGFALELERFARTMPKPKTRRQRWLEKLAEKSRPPQPQKDRDRGMGLGL